MTISEDIKPVSFTFGNTGRCQSRCITCAAWKTPESVKEDELTTQQWKDIMLKMHDWLGNFTFIFSGGEPFLRDDIFELADYAADLGITANVVTNGLALSDKCERVIDSGIKTIVFSLNSVKDPSLHVDSRGRKDSFKKTIDVIQKINYLNKQKNAGKYISLSSVVMPSNLSEIQPLAEFAKAEGIGVCYQLLDNGDAFIPPSDTTLDADGLKGDISTKAIAAVELMISLKKQDYPICNSFAQLDAFKALMKKPETTTNDENNSHSIEKDTQEFSTDINKPVPQNSTDIANLKCQIGYNNFAVDPYGEVRICFCFDSIGSLKNSSPQELWTSEKADLLREKISNCKMSCKLLNCNFSE